MRQAQAYRQMKHLVTLAGLAVFSCSVPQPRSTPLTMAALHQSGGVPPHWKFTLPAGDRVAGRQLFADLGCPACHAVQGEHFDSAPHGAEGVGPDLTGMGSHHPAEYFAESIVNPNAVLVDGPEYLGPDGQSRMPAYDDLSVRQLADLVAYLQSLRDPADTHSHIHGARSFVVDAQELTPEQFDAFEDWFATDGMRRLNAAVGFVSIDTYVTRTAQGRLVVTTLGFTDDAVLHDFVERARAAAPDEFGGLLRSTERVRFRSPTVYRAIGLSLP